MEPNRVFTVKPGDVVHLQWEVRLPDVDSVRSGVGLLALELWREKQSLGTVQRRIDLAAKGTSWKVPMVKDVPRGERSIGGLHLRLYLDRRPDVFAETPRFKFLGERRGRRAAQGSLDSSLGGAPAHSAAHRAQSRSRARSSPS